MKTYPRPVTIMDGPHKGIEIVVSEDVLGVVLPPIEPGDGACHYDVRHAGAFSFRSDGTSRADETIRRELANH